MGTEMPVTWKVDFGDILEVLNSGVRRSDVFMGIGLNSATSDPSISHVLSTKGAGVQLVKTDLTDEEKKSVAHEFGKWIRANGFRELLETFSIYLLRLYDVIYNLHQAYGDGSKIMDVRRFERLGICDQIDYLRKFISILDERVTILQSLNQARNCYAHRRGLVGDADLDADTGTFDVSWLRLVYEVQEPDGTIIPEEEMFGRFLPKGGAVRIRVELTKKSFAPGDELVLEKEDLKYICLCVHTIGHGLADETLKYALARGAEAIPAPEPEVKAISQDDQQ